MRIEAVHACVATANNSHKADSIFIIKKNKNKRRTFAGSVNEMKNGDVGRFICHKPSI